MIPRDRVEEGENAKDDENLFLSGETSTLTSNPESGEPSETEDESESTDTEDDE